VGVLGVRVEKGEDPIARSFLVQRRRLPDREQMPRDGEIGRRNEVLGVEIRNQSNFSTIRRP
jgi:hypothetical protein